MFGRLLGSDSKEKFLDDVISGLFRTNTREKFLENVQLTKSRVEQSNLSPAKKQLFLIFLNDAAASEQSLLMMIFARDADIAPKEQLLKKVLELSTKSDDHALRAIKEIITDLKLGDEAKQKLTSSVSATETELEQRRKFHFNVAAAIAVAASLVVAYIAPIPGTLLLAAEIGAALKLDLKPHFNELNEMYETGMLMSCIVDGLEKSRKELAVKTFQPPAP